MSTVIRASMLPSYPDCPRRAAAGQYRREIAAAGFTLRALEPTVGAAIGTAVHAATAHLLRRKRDGQPLILGEAWEQAIAGFREEIAGGAIWDDTTPDARTAVAQIERLTKAYALEVLLQVEPLLIEEELKADAGDGFQLSGHVDLFTADDEVRDTKTGAEPRAYHSQLGGYSLLLRSNGHQPRRLMVDFVKRSRIAKPQASVVTSEYDRADSECAAMGTITAIKRDVTRFRDSGSADPWAFLANPGSMMCGDKYCEAWGTDWCRVGRKKEHQDA